MKSDPRHPVRILFVCHGNICRSPMAEFIFRDLTARAGMQDRFVIASAATSREELGNPVYPPVRRMLESRGIDCTGKTARQVTAADYGNFDLLIGMDRANFRNLHRICNGDPEGKVHLLLEYAGEDREVADPWYNDDFETAWRDISAGCEGLLAHLLGN